MVYNDNYDYLQHHGVKGMKWGVRRDRLTTSSGDGKIRVQRQKRDAVNDLRTTKKIVDNASTVINESRKLSNVTINTKAAKQINKNVSQMSDQELKNVVNRLNMEERYTQVMSQRAIINSGKARIDRILDGAGTALAISSSALTIALAIKELMR